MYPGPPPSPPSTPGLGANRLVASLAWLVAAGAAVAAVFTDIYTLHSGSVKLTQGFWEQKITTGDQSVPSVHVAHGVNPLIGAVVVLAGALLGFLVRQRRAGLVVGTFGSGVLVAVAVQWTVIVTAAPASSPITPKTGFWLLIVAAVAAVVALAFSAVERTRPAGPAGYAQPPSWELPTPRFGVPTQQQPQWPTASPDSGTATEKPPQHPVE